MNHSHDDSAVLGDRLPLSSASSDLAFASYLFSDNQSVVKTRLAYGGEVHVKMSIVSVKQRFP